MNVSTTRRFRFFVWLWALMCAGAPAMHAAEAEKAANDLAIRMSPYEVSANSVDFKRWIKVSSPNYIVYTDANVKEANAALRELEMLHLAAQAFFRRRTLNLSPTIVVLPTSGSDWRKIESKSKAEWRAAVSAPAGRLVNMIVTQYDWQNESLWIVRSAQTSVLLESLNLEGPFWFSRGVGSFFETAELEKDSVVIGRQNTRTHTLSWDGWLPWDRFFRIDGDSPEFIREAVVNRLEGQCAAFVQFMLAHPEPVWFERLIEWAALLQADREPTEEEFKRVFGQDLKTWQKTMEAYMRTGRYYVRTVRMPPGALNYTPIKIDLAVREMRELFVLVQILNQDVKASDEALDGLLARGLKTEALRELLAEACFRRARDETGLEQARAIMAAGSVNPALPAALAKQKFWSAIRKPSLEARFTARDASEIRALAERALAIEPRHKDAADTLAWVEALGPEVDAATLERLEKMYRLLADHVATSDVLSALAVARWRAGQTDRARAVAEALRDSPFADKEAREIAGKLLHALDRGK